MPRPIKYINKEELEEKLFKYQGVRGKLQKIADEFKVSLQTIYNKLGDYDLSPKTIYGTPKLVTEIDWDGMLKEAKSFASIAERNMSQTEVNIKMSDDFILYLIADAHIGNVHTDLEKLYEDVDLIRENPFIRVGFQGDIIDNYIIGNSPGDGYQDQVLSPIDQRRRAESIVKRLSDKIFWIIQGDHGDWSYGIDGFDMSQYMAEKCSGYWLGFGGMVNLTIGKNTYKIHTVHRTQRGTTVGIRDVAWGLKYDRMYKYDFDIGISAHLHRPGISIGNYKGKRVYYINCGTYKLLDRYGKKKGYRKCDPDKPALIFRKNKKYIEPYMSLEDAISAY